MQTSVPLMKRLAVQAILAVGIGLAPLGWTSCAVTTEADATSSEQRAYASCLDTCRKAPAEQDDGSSDTALRICRDDCSAEYPQDDWRDDSREVGMGAGAPLQPHPPPTVLE